MPSALPWWPLSSFGGTKVTCVTSLQRKEKRGRLTLRFAKEAPIPLGGTAASASF
jgi:hypothetical protein